MFDIAFPHARRLYDVARVLDDHCYDLTFEVTEVGLKMVQMSSDRVVLFRLDIPQTVFWKKDIKESTRFAISAEHFKKVLSYARRDDYVRLRMDDKGLRLSLTGAYEREFRIPLEDEEPLEFNVPEPPFTAGAVLIGYAFKDIVRIMDWNDDPAKAVKLEVKDDKVIFETHGAEELGSRVVLTLEDEPLLDVDSDEPVVTSYYGNHYLRSISRVVKRNDDVVLKFFDEGPLSIRTPLGDDEILFEALLAPRIVD